MAKNETEMSRACDSSATRKAGDRPIASEKVCELESRKSPALAIVRSQRQAEVTDLISGRGGTRTLDPGIMRAVDRKNSL
jgi:hypothetical protein